VATVSLKKTKADKASQKFNDHFIPMRLDLFLKASRFCPRRTVAQKLCDAGLVSVNGSPAKPAHAVNPGDEIRLNRRHKVSTFRVLSVPEARQTAKASASGLYELISEEVLSDVDA